MTEPADAEIAIVNTCGFLQASRKESIETIREVCALKKKKNGLRAVLVAGCMVGNYKQELLNEVPEVDRLVEFGEYDKIAEMVDALLPKASAASFLGERRRIDASLTPAHYAYLKISEGCNRICSFCVIPDIRGKMRSVSEDDLVRRAETLAARGVKEISLIAQDSTVYGTDLLGAPGLERLLKRLDGVDGLEWIRLMYAYPTEVTLGLMDTLASGKAPPPLPRRSGPARVGFRAQADEARIRSPDSRAHGRRAPQARLRDPHDRHRRLPRRDRRRFRATPRLRAVVRVRPARRVPVLREEGSGAGALDGQVAEEVKEERFARLMEAQQEIAFRQARASVGTRERVLVDAAGREGRAGARTHEARRARSRRPGLDPIAGVRPGRSRRGRDRRRRRIRPDRRDPGAQACPPRGPMNPAWFNLPNRVTLARLVASMILFVLLANLPEPRHEASPVGIAAFVLFVLVAASDWLDGCLARKYGQVTTIGRILDPFVDKVAVCGTYVMLLRSPPVAPLIEAWMVVVIVAREFFVNDSRGYFESKGVSFGAEAPGKIKMLVSVRERQPPPARARVPGHDQRPSPGQRGAALARGRGNRPLRRLLHAEGDPADPGSRRLR